MGAKETANIGEQETRAPFPVDEMATYVRRVVRTASLTLDDCR